MARSKPKERQQWIMDYITKTDPFVDALNSPFMDAYIDKFQMAHFWHVIGAPLCPDAGKQLLILYRRRLLSRFRIGIDCWQPGFPKWVWVYSLSKDEELRQTKLGNRKPIHIGFGEEGCGVDSGNMVSNWDGVTCEDCLKLWRLDNEK
jgi:hypothetical protein